MYEFIEENKNKLIVIGVIIGITIIFAVLNIFLNSSNKQNHKYKQYLEELGKIYYEDLYYPALKEQFPNEYEQSLKNYSNNGIKVTLFELLNSIESIEYEIFFDESSDTHCDFDKTYVTIYPYAPYLKENYKINVYEFCDSEYKED